MTRPSGVLATAAFSMLVSAALAQDQPEAPQQANPSAVYCIANGGSYKIVTEAAGQRGICVLPDGNEVDAWEYFRSRQGTLPKTD